MKFLFRNQDIVVVEKPSGVLTTPSRIGEMDRRPCLGLQLQNFVQAQIYPVHRLDFEVSGLVIFALQPKAHAQAGFWFENRLVKKTYEAMTEGEPDSGWKIGQEFQWKNKLLRGKKRAYESPAGKWSETIGRWRGWKSERMWWELHPLTGRPHQLRVHLMQNGFPILGDELYGALMPYKPDSIALKAVALDFSEIEPEMRLGLPVKIEIEGIDA